MSVVKAKILERCGATGGIKGLQRTLAIMDDNGDKRLTKEELKYGLRDYGIDLNMREIDEVFLQFDKNKDGFIDTTEFFVAIRGDLNPRRKALVKLAFDILDKDKSGIITIDEIAQVYDTSKNPDVLSGRKTKEQALMDFIHVWDRTEHDGAVTWDEFEDYYKEISASIDADDYFELMIRNAWHIAGGKGAAANSANRRVLVTKADGSQSVECINDDLGVRAGDVTEMKARLARQGVRAEAVGLFHGDDSTGGKGFGQRTQKTSTAAPAKDFTKSVKSSSIAAAAAISAQRRMKPSAPIRSKSAGPTRR